MKKFLFSVFILAIFAGVVFYFGWVQFKVPFGMSGVLVSRTSGVNPKTIENGEFRFAWQCLIPHNATIRLFSKTPVQFSQNMSGQLYSANLYSGLLSAHPDFSYDFTVQLEITPKQSELPNLVSTFNITNQDEMQNYLQNQSTVIAQSVIDFVLKNIENNQTMPTSQEIIASLNAQDSFAKVNIVSVNVSAAKMPDFAEYALAKKTFSAIQSELEKAAQNQALKAASDSVHIIRLKNIADVLNQNPNVKENITQIKDYLQAISVLESR